MSENSTKKYVGYIVPLVTGSRTGTSGVIAPPFHSANAPNCDEKGRSGEGVV
jgi:hypothetical protein